MHNSVQNKGTGSLKKVRAIIWAHAGASILSILLAASGLWFPSAATTQESPEQSSEESPEQSPEQSPEESPEQSPSLDLDLIIELSPGFSPDPLVIRGISGGSIPAAEIANRDMTHNGPCVGLVAEEPDHRIVLTKYFNYLSLEVSSSEDTTLVIRGPGGSWCNDDQEDKNPGIAGQWLKGTYEVWIGSYEENNYRPYTIKITGAPLLNPFGR